MHSQALLAGTLDVARRAAQLLNAHGKVPMYANPGSFVNHDAAPIWLNESRLVAALEGTQWISYYESARAEQVLSGAGKAAGSEAWMLQNMLREGSLGVPGGGVHAYYRHNDTAGTVEAPLPHVAAFMLARQEHWYYFGSTGWFDASYRWDALYDMRCGLPLGAAYRLAAGPRAYGREYERCTVSVDCTGVDPHDATAECAASISAA
jgi:hypothetical protein